MGSTDLISPRMELNQYHLLTKKVLFRLSYRGIQRVVCHTKDPSDPLFRPDCAWCACGVCVFCAVYAACAFCSGGDHLKILRYSLLLLT